jgi:hypothetical protein
MGERICRIHFSPAHFMGGRELVTNHHPDAAASGNHRARVSRASDEWRVALTASEGRRAVATGGGRAARPEPVVTSIPFSSSEAPAGAKEASVLAVAILPLPLRSRRGFSEFWSTGCAQSGFTRGYTPSPRWGEKARDVNDELASLIH